MKLKLTDQVIVVIYVEVTCTSLTMLFSEILNMFEVYQNLWSFKDLKFQIVKICILCKCSCPFIIIISSCLIKNIICQHVFYFADSNQFGFGNNYTSYDFIIINLLRFGESRGSFCTLVTTKDGNLETRAHSVNIEELLRQETERHNQQVIKEI